MILSDDTNELGFLGACDPRIREAYDYWDRKRAGRRMPSRADLDPVEIPRLLPHIILVDVLRDPLRFRYRLVGTDIVEKRGFDPTGRMVGDAYFGATPGEVLGRYYDIVENRRVRFIDAPFVEPRGWYAYSERLMMPLSSDGATVDMVFICALWRDAVHR